ncbi:proton extrusion protein PcxA [Lusitaniella coriacea]|uniref:proton extrusion protein PcxA n=1 Tax=Lusitaniella coriacea TaxID=1983105 RepID=UPI003CED7480
MKLNNLFNTVKCWLTDTPDRALERAYRAALTIKAIEDEYFSGQKVCIQANEYGENVWGYCQTEVKNNLKIAKRGLAEFNATRSFIGKPEPQSDYLEAELSSYSSDLRERAAITIEKLNFIDEVLSKYKKRSKRQKVDKTSLSLVEIPPENQNSVAQTIEKSSRKLRKTESERALNPESENKEETLPTITDKAGVLPRSLLRTLRRIQRDVDPNVGGSEAAAIEKFRQSRNRTAISIRFLLVLIIVPLLTHQITKNFLINPIVDRSLFDPNIEVVFLNEDMQEEAMEELHQFERALEFKQLLGLVPKQSDRAIEEQVKEKALEIAENYRHRGSSSVANIFADICSIIAFTWVILISKRDILILKSFIDELVYGLSDSAKSFLIILFTDMFVGFHSPHGWEIVLEGISRHFGLPESRDFNFLFIATFPVILDTVLKYWIFRYLNRISPSAVATYKTMNE